jgi:hypothetical protein
MAQFTGVKLEKLQGGLGRKEPSTDSHLALCIRPTGINSLDTLIRNGGKGLTLTSLSQAESLGLTQSASYNTGNPFHFHISEFFRLAPEGTLYLYIAFNIDAYPIEILPFLKANKEIKGFALYCGSGEFPTDNLIGFLQNDIIDALAAENRLIDFCVLGLAGFLIGQLAVDFTQLACPQVSVLVAGIGVSNQPAVGSFLGMIAARKVNENVGSVAIQNPPIEKRGQVDYPLTDINKGLWLDANLTGDTNISSLTKAQLTQLEAFGYIFAASYEGYPGVFFNNSKTCISEASDYCYIENNRVWNKAARTLRASLLPEVKGVVKKNPTTGFIKSTTVSRWTGIANKALEQMVSDDEISGFEVFINPNQVVNSSQPVKITAKVVADGIVHEFEVALGLNNSLN